MVEAPKENQPPAMPNDPAIMGVSEPAPSLWRKSNGLDDRRKRHAVYTATKGANVILMTRCFFTSVQANLLACHLLGQVKRCEPWLTFITVNAPSSAAARATFPAAASVPQPAGTAATLPTSLRWISSRPAAAAIPATVSFPGTRWTSWLSWQPRLCPQLWNGLWPIAARLRHAAVWPSSRSGIPSAAARRVFAQQPAHAYWPARPAETANARRSPGPGWDWKQARNTPACCWRGASAAASSEQHEACRDAIHAGCRAPSPACWSPAARRVETLCCCCDRAGSSPCANSSADGCKEGRKQPCRTAPRSQRRDEAWPQARCRSPSSRSCGCRTA